MKKLFVKHTKRLLPNINKRLNLGGIEKTSPLQIYSGYTDDDILLLRSFITQKACLEKNFYIDGFSQRTLYASVPFCKDFNLKRLTLPVPDDGFHAEALEYIAVCDTVQRTESMYSIVELGAGWGPWISLGGVLAHQRGIKSINLIGVEAHPERFELMRNQLSANQLRPPGGPDVTELDGIRCNLIQGAVSPEHKTLWFPKVDIKDMGAAASDQDRSNDYRGLSVQNFSVSGFTLEEIVGDLEIDMLHVDIQGAEFELLQSSLHFINERVKAMMIATHSRVIEGRLMELLYANGWYLHREKPCWVEWKTSPASMEAMTRVDGCQYWRR